MEKIIINEYKKHGRVHATMYFHKNYTDGKDLRYALNYVNYLAVKHNFINHKISIV